MHFSFTKDVLVPTLFVAMCSFKYGSAQSMDEPLRLSQFSDGFIDEYDFVIVGAGSGGCVMANRLSEVTNWTVLLLEAGDEEIHFLTDVPLTAASITLTSKCSVHSHSDRSRAHQIKSILTFQVKIGVIKLSGSRKHASDWPVVFAIGPKGGQWVVRALLITYCTIEAIKTTSMSGLRWATRAGASRRCCHISKNQNELIFHT